ERDADVVDDDVGTFTGEAQRELATDAAPGSGDDGDAAVEQPHGYAAATAVALPVIALSPFWLTTVMSRSTRCSPASSRVPVTVAVACNTSPGQTCLENRTWSRRIDSGPNQSFTTRAARPMLSMP